MGFKEHKLKLQQNKTDLKKYFHHRLKYTHKYQISECRKASPHPVHPFVLKTPSHFCVLVGTVFALGNQI